VYLGQMARIKLNHSRQDFDGKVTKISPMGVRRQRDHFRSPRIHHQSGRRTEAAMTANAEIVLEEHKKRALDPGRGLDI